MGEFDGVLHDVALGIQVGRDVDRRVRHQQQAVIGRHVQHEHMAHAPAAAQPVGRDRRFHQFVGMEAAFHQRRDLAGARHRDGLGGGCMAVLGGDDRHGIRLEAGGGKRLYDLRPRPDQDGIDQAGLRRPIRPLDRARIAGMNDGAADARQVLAHGQKPRQQIRLAIERQWMHRRPQTQGSGRHPSAKEGGGQRPLVAAMRPIAQARS